MKTTVRLLPPHTTSIFTFFIAVGSILSLMHEFTPYLNWGENSKSIFFLWFSCLLVVLYINRLKEYASLKKKVDELTGKLESVERNRDGLIQQYNRSNKKIKSMKIYNSLLWSEIERYTSSFPDKEKSEVYRRILMEDRVSEAIQDGKIQSSKNNR